MRKVVDKDGAGGLPAIHLSASDHDALSRLVGELPGTGAAGLLQQELDRAVVFDDAKPKVRAVGLNHWFEYSDSRASEPRRVQLVLPKDADIDAGKVSVLSHVGAGLIGVTEGQAIIWTDPQGGERTLKPLKIEREG